MFTAFENCKSIEEVANNAARFERMNLKREYTKNSNEIFSIPTTYEFYYENSEMKLLGSWLRIFCRFIKKTKRYR